MTLTTPVSIFTLSRWIEDDDPADILQETKALISFLDETGSLDSEGESASVLVDHLDAIEQ